MRSRTLAHFHAFSRTNILITYSVHVRHAHLPKDVQSCSSMPDPPPCEDYASSCSNPAIIFAWKSVAHWDVSRGAWRVLRCRRTSAHASPLPTARSGGDRGFRQRFLKSHGIRSSHPFPLSELIENQFLKTFDLLLINSIFNSFTFNLFLYVLYIIVLRI